MNLKQAYQQSNHHQAAVQIVPTKAPKEFFHYRQLISNAVAHFHNNDMPRTYAPFKRKMKNPQPEICTLDDLAKWCAMPRGELQNYIAWCFKRFVELTEYVHHDQYFSRPNDPKYIHYNAVAIPVTYFQCDEQEVHIVHCTQSTRWRMHKPPRNDTVLLRMGTSPDKHCMAPVGCILAQLQCLFVLGDAEWMVNGHLAVVQTYATGLRCQTVGMVIVQKRHQPPTEATIVTLISASESFISSLQAQSNMRYTIICRYRSHRALGGTWATRLTWMLSICITCGLFSRMLEVIIAGIYTHLISVLSGCLKCCNGSCASLSIIDISRDKIVKNILQINGTGQKTVDMIKI